MVGFKSNVAPGHYLPHSKVPTPLRNGKSSEPGTTKPKLGKIVTRALKLLSRSKSNLSEFAVENLLFNTIRSKLIL